MRFLLAAIALLTGGELYAAPSATGTAPLALERARPPGDTDEARDSGDEPADEPSGPPPEAAAPLVGPVDPGEHPDAVEPTMSKKERLLAEKQNRHAIHRNHLPLTSAMATAALSIRNVWTHEILPVELPPSPLMPPAPATKKKPIVEAAIEPAPSPAPKIVNSFLRDHFTNQATAMDPRLVAVVLRAAAKFGSSVVEVVSGYRSPKYNLMLRKKGHAVARESQHPLGQALDFRLAGVTTKTLYNFVRLLHLGGVGYYPQSAFVHADVGRIRFWRGN